MVSCRAWPRGSSSNTACGHRGTRPERWSRIRKRPAAGQQAFYRTAPDNGRSGRFLFTAIPADAPGGGPQRNAGEISTSFVFDRGDFQRMFHAWRGWPGAVHRGAGARLGLSWSKARAMGSIATRVPSGVSGVDIDYGVAVALPGLGCRIPSRLPYRPAGRLSEAVLGREDPVTRIRNLITACLEHIHARKLPRGEGGRGKECPGALKPIRGGGNHRQVSIPKIPLPQRWCDSGRKGKGEAMPVGVARWTL